MHVLCGLCAPLCGGFRALFCVVLFVFSCLLCLFLCLASDGCGTALLKRILALGMIELMCCFLVYVCVCSYLVVLSYPLLGVLLWLVWWFWLFLFGWLVFVSWSVLFVFFVCSFVGVEFSSILKSLCITDCSLPVY